MSVFKDIYYIIVEEFSKGSIFSALFYILLFLMLSHMFISFIKVIISAFMLALNIGD